MVYISFLYMFLYVQNTYSVVVLEVQGEYGVEYRSGFIETLDLLI